MNIDNKIKEIKEFLRAGTIADVATFCEYHRILGGQFAYLSEQLTQYENIKAVKTEQIREDKAIKSDARAERIFLASISGQEYTAIKNELKAIGKMMSSVNTSINNSVTEISGQKYN